MWGRGDRLKLGSKIRFCSYLMTGVLKHDSYGERKQWNTMPYLCFPLSQLSSSSSLLVGFSCCPPSQPTGNENRKSASVPWHENGSSPVRPLGRGCYSYGRLCSMILRHFRLKWRYSTVFSFILRSACDNRTDSGLGKVYSNAVPTMTMSPLSEEWCSTRGLCCKGEKYVLFQEDPRTF